MPPAPRRLSEPRRTRHEPLETVLELLVPILDVAALTVDGVDGLGRQGQVGHDEARIAAGARPGYWTTSAFMITRRLRPQLRAA